MIKIRKMLSFCIIIIFILNNMLNFNQLQVKANTDPSTIDSTWTVIDESNAGQFLNITINDLIQQGINKIYIKNGNYNINDCINIDEPNVELLGQSKENTKIIQTEAGKNSINVLASSVTVSGLTIDSRVQGGYAGFYTRDSDDVILRDCIIYGSTSTAAVFFAGKTYSSGTDVIAAVEGNQLVNNNVMDGNIIYSNITEDGVYFGKQNNGTISNNTVVGARISFSLCKNSRLINNNVQDSTSKGIVCEVPSYDNIISNNIISNSKSAGIAVLRYSTTDVSADYRADNITIENNTVNDGRYFGIEINNLKNSSIRYNTINSCDLSGIYLLYCDSLNIKGNNINDSSTDQIRGNLWGWNDTLNSGIFADYMVKDSVFEDNTIKNTSYQCPYGVKVQPDDSNTSNQVVNNSIQGLIEIPVATRIDKNTISGDNGFSVPKNIRVIQGRDSITLKWDDVPGAYGYYIEVDGVKIDNGFNTEYNHIALSRSSTHQYRVMTYYGTWSDIIISSTLVEAPPNIKFDSTYTTIKVSWDSVLDSTGYDIDVDGVLTDNGSNTEYVHKNLNSNSIHKYRVRAKNGEWSQYFDCLTLQPQAPDNIVINSGLDNIKINWDAIPGVTGYEVEVDGVVIDNGSSTNYTSNGLFNCSNHTYRIRAKDGIWTSYIEATTLAPSAPTNILTVSTNNSIKISWDFISGANGYEVEVDGKVIDNGMSNGYNDLSLDPDSKHKYRIRAKGGTWSNTINASTLMLDDPKNVMVKPSISTIKISWDNVPGAVGYELNLDGNIIDVESSNSYIYSGLVANSKHNYQVRAKHGKWSELRTAYTLTPPKPSNITVASTTNSIVIEWDSIPEVYDYEIYVDGIIIDNGNSTKYTYSLLEPNSIHSYKVRAKGGLWSDTINASTLMLDNPKNIIVKPTVSTIKIKWDRVFSATGYEINLDGKIIDVGSSNSYIYSGLVANSKHNYQVRAKNGKWSELRTVNTLTPPRPSNITVASTTNSIVIEWDSIPEVNDYEIYVDGIIVDNGSSNKYTHASLKSNSSHIYKVRAKDGFWSDIIIAKTLTIPTPIDPEPVKPPVNPGPVTPPIKPVPVVEVPSDKPQAVTKTPSKQGIKSTINISNINIRPSVVIGGKSQETNGISPKDTIVNIKTICLEDKIIIEWNDIPNAIGYEIEVDGKVLDNRKSNEYIHLRLESGSSHTYRVRAKNGNWSKLIKVNVLDRSDTRRIDRNLIYILLLLILSSLCILLKKYFKKRNTTN